MKVASMGLTRIVLTGVAALTLGSAAFAQQAQTGRITKLDRLNNSVAIQKLQDGTVGANTGGASEEFKVQDGVPLDAVHAGDRVNYSATEAGGVKTITKLQKQ
jgi:Cu/Ag efflux protein CusF